MKSCYIFLLLRMDNLYVFYFQTVADLIFCTPTGLTGCAMQLILLIILGCSIRKFRNKFYNLFFSVHHFFIIYMILLIIHPFRYVFLLLIDVRIHYIYLFNFITLVKLLRNKIMLDKLYQNSHRKSHTVGFILAHPSSYLLLTRFIVF